MAKDKPTVTGQFVAQKKPVRICRVPASHWLPIPPNREPIDRLSWNHPWEKVDCEVGDLARIIRRSVLPQALFFLDTNFFTKAIDDCLWQAILERDLVITPLVRQCCQGLSGGKGNCSVHVFAC